MANNWRNETPGLPHVGVYTKPNVRCDENYDFFATRDIKAGEDLLASYPQCSDDENRPVPNRESSAVRYLIIGATRAPQSRLTGPPAPSVPPLSRYDHIT